MTEADLSRTAIKPNLQSSQANNKMEKHSLGEKYNGLLDKLYSGGKKSKILYWTLIIGSPLGSFIFGIVLALVFGEGMMYIEHNGWVGKSSFSYMNLNPDGFVTTFYQDTHSNFRTLKVASSWKNDIGGQTDWRVEPSQEGITIDCWVGSPNQNCKDYQVEKHSHQILNLNISITTKPNPKSYNLCFTTNEGDNKNNNYEDCLPIVILPKQPETSNP